MCVWIYAKRGRKWKRVEAGSDIMREGMREGRLLMRVRTRQDTREVCDNIAVSVGVRIFIERRGGEDSGGEQARWEGRGVVLGVWVSVYVCVGVRIPMVGGTCMGGGFWVVLLGSWWSVELRAFDNINARCYIGDINNWMGWRCV